MPLHMRFGSVQDPGSLTLIEAGGDRFLITRTNSSGTVTNLSINVVECVHGGPKFLMELNLCQLQVFKD